VIAGPFLDASKPDGRYFEMRVRDTINGLAQVALREYYSDGVTPYTINASVSPALPLLFNPPTTATIVVQFWKTTPGNNSRIGLLVTDGLGVRREMCDPMFDDLSAATDRTYDGVLDTDRIVTVINDAPGVDTVTVEVNPGTDLAATLDFDFTGGQSQRQTRVIDAHLYVGAGNTIRVRSSGSDPAGTAVLLLSDQPIAP
jgi:hypothetical protein